MIDKMRQNSNKYMEFVAIKKKKSDGDWGPIEENYEMWVFISILFIMSLVGMTKLRNYWLTNPFLFHDMIKTIMPQNRFLKILQYFHVSDKANELGRDHSDFNIFQKLEPLTEKLKRNCQNSFIRTKKQQLMKLLFNIFEVWKLCSIFH